MSLKNDFIRKRTYVVPDCQVHQFAYELMGIVGSPPKKGPDGGDVTEPTGPGGPGLDAKGYTFSFNIWDEDKLEDDNTLDDDF